MLNKVILVGRITADPELRQTPNGVSVTSFSIALDRPYSKDSEKITDFIDIIAWRNTAEFICKHFQKGNAIGIDGRIQVREYTDKNGNKRRAVEVLAENVSFVEKKITTPSAAPQLSATTDFEEIESDGQLPF